MASVIVTGSAGYIGGHTVLELEGAGYDVVGIDQREHSTQIAASLDQEIVDDFASAHSLNLIAAIDPVAVVHCAGTSLVGPSVTNPEIYFQNNFVKTKILVDSLISNNLSDTRIIFSSSASVYGNPVMTPIHETDPLMPVSPYGQSKLMVEFLLNSYNTAYNTNHVMLRYFNACGCDAQLRHGHETGDTHIIPRVLEAVQNQDSFNLYGTNFPTADGTCIRDYVHVTDIARAHVLAINGTVPPAVYNLANERGYSNREIISAVEQVTGTTVDVNETAVREGDAAELTADATHFKQVAGWQPTYTLEEMIDHAWQWQQQL